MRFFTVLFSLLASAALACPVCGAETDQSVYLAMTIFMSLTPLAAMGTLGWVVYSRSRRQDAPPPPQ